VADAQIQVNLTVDGPALAAALPVFTKMLTAATVHGYNTTRQHGASGPPEDAGRVWLELPAQFADPAYTRHVLSRDAYLGEWQEVVPGVEFRVMCPLTTEASLEFRFHPSGQPGA
jgi:hypothetical protein